MTTHYIDIRLLPDPEFSPAHLWRALYAKLHRALVQQAISSVGVSFPQYQLRSQSLGQVLRLHGHATPLEQFMATDWLKGMYDHVDITPVGLVPSQAQHRIVQRRQFKTSAERLRRRRMQRKGETAEQAAIAIPSHVERNPRLPYVQLRSNSSGQSFYLWIELGPLHETPVPGSFNTYGLGQADRGASIPWF
ncbi:MULTISPECIES: type I-F CRISPR-associated endoribonuclease Cas6/Csy4 [Giesbergeria]|uniref:Type I-F CRISPR-associated endoribonuclease Cas6/Csy4 n=1 Tax=Giesbergeria sinuosa TaxID=80883 RepID=A0ABV9QBM7_9BURK